MVSSNRTLPDGYSQTHEINLAKNKGLAILLTLAGMIVFCLSLVLLGPFVRWARPELLTRAITFTLGLSGILAFLASVPLVMLVHEFIHGFFFRVFTHSRPVFALRLLYAYAAAPDWFIPTGHYGIIGLAPLVLIDMMGLLCIFLVPVGWIPLFAFAVALNTCGSVGDLFIVARLLRLSPGSFAKDAGDRVSFFEPTTAVSKSA